MTVSLKTDTLADHIRTASFPCLGAKAALAKKQLSVMTAHDLFSARDDRAIHRRLVETGQAYRRDGELFRSFAVMFEGTPAYDEAEMEAALWTRLQALSDYDAGTGYAPDHRISSDPDSHNFALSFGGEGFFVLMLHPNASRASRRFDRCAVIFNLHHQFETLREDGRFEKLSETIIARDTVYSGSRNLMLGEHGKVSSARQYSGRNVGDNWCCPFSRRDTVQNAA